MCEQKNELEKCGYCGKEVNFNNELKIICPYCGHAIYKNMDDLSDEEIQKLADEGDGEALYRIGRNLLVDDPDKSFEFFEKSVGLGFIKPTLY